MKDDLLKNLHLIRGVTHTDWGTIHTYSNFDDTIRFALYWYDDDNETIYFSNLYIDPMYRNTGIASRIFDWVFAYAREGNLYRYENIVLNVKKNSWMQHWYERLGFEYLEDCGEDYPGNIWMIKNL